MRQAPLRGIAVAGSDEIRRRPEPDDRRGGGPGRAPEPGRIRPTQPGPVAGFLVVGLVCGWLIRRIWLHFGWTDPNVSWVTIGLLVFLAAALGVAAYVTHQAVRPHPDSPRPRTPLLPHQAVNRLVLGKASALVGALLLGGFVGYAISQIGVSTSDLAGTRLWRSLLAAAGSLGVMVAGLLLERACRVPDDDDQAPSL